MADQESCRQELYGLLGELPSREREVTAEVISVQQGRDYVLETLRLDLNGIEPVPAYLARPADNRGERPTVLFNHSHGGGYDIGKEELVGPRSYLHSPPYAVALTQLGYNVLCIDHWAFGERRGRTESEIFKEMLWYGRVMWGMMVFDSLRAVDYLIARDDVCDHRIGTIGISMGATMAWWMAALDPRVAVCVDLCCMTDFESLIRQRGLDGHGVYYYVPSLLRHFSTADINALICPRPHLSMNGNYDALTPADGLCRIDREMQELYDKSGVREAWQMVRYDQGHFENPDMRRRALDFLNRYL